MVVVVVVVVVVQHTRENIAEKWYVVRCAEWMYLNIGTTFEEIFSKLMMPLLHVKCRMWVNLAGSQIQTEIQKGTTHC